MSTDHYLKLDHPWFGRVRSGEKRAEVRKHDRDYQAGDNITFVGRRPGDRTDYEFSQSNASYLLDRDPDLAEENPEHVRRPNFTARITHVMVRTETTANFLPEGYCLLSIEVLQPTPEEILRAAFGSSSTTEES